MTLSEARGLIGWTQTRLAREVGVSVSTINDLESGGNKNPGYRLVMNVIKALQRGGLAGITPENIFPVHKPSSKGKAVA
jgi:transcriptional regulator with XRE-family HTH domain